MNDNELDARIAALAPVRDADVARWALAAPLSELCEEIMSPTPTQPQAPVGHDRHHDIPIQSPFDPAGADPVQVRHHGIGRRRRPKLLAVLTAGSVALLVGGLFLVSGGNSDDQNADSPATSPAAASAPTEQTPEALTPAATLPSSADVSIEVPPTIVATGPVDWYRLAPDLDISWYRDGTEPSMICLRTPVDETCQIDDSTPDQPLTAPTAGGQLLVIVTGDQSIATAQIGLSDDTVVAAPISWDDKTGFGVARVKPADGSEVTSVSIGDKLEEAADGTDFTGETLPPAADLIEVPMTIPEGQGLAYWRWLPDLDFSEVQPTTGPTQFCYRTPAGEGCIDEEFNSPNVGIVPTTDGVIALVQPELTTITPPPTDPLAPTLQAGPQPSTVIAQLSDGTTTSSDVNYSDQYGLGWARVSVPDGVTIIEIRSE